MKKYLFLLVGIMTVCADAQTMGRFTGPNGYGGYGGGYGRGFGGGGFGGFGGFYNPRNTGALGAAVNNKFRITIWNTLPRDVEVFFDDQRTAIKSGDRKSKNLNGASLGAALLSSNFLPEEWLTEKMVAVRVVGDKGKPAFKKVTPVIHNQSSYSKRSLTLIVGNDESGLITIREVDDTEESEVAPQVGRMPRKHDPKPAVRGQPQAPAPMVKELDPDRLALWRQTGR